MQKGRYHRHCHIVCKNVDWTDLLLKLVATRKVTPKSSINNLFFLLVALRPNAGYGLLILEVSRSHKTTHHIRQDSSGRVIGRDLYLTTQNTNNRLTFMPQRDSNSQSQQASGRRPTPWTARPLGPAYQLITSIFKLYKHSYMYRLASVSILWD